MTDEKDPRADLPESARSSLPKTWGTVGHASPAHHELWHRSRSCLDDRYELLGVLGEGGFGAVFLARQRSTEQKVAVKILRSSEPDVAASNRRTERFLREARLCAELHHPNLVSLIDAGKTEDGAFHIVFGFVPGLDLAEVLARESSLEPGEARHLMLQVLDALACAHAQGVVHRDLKPENIMVVPTGARRNAVVLDFGIGALFGETRPAERLTETGEALGTPGYSAPEQLRGLPLSPAADLFAWGVVFLECLTGQRVFRGASAADIMVQVLGPQPVAIPPALEGHVLGDILRSATRKDPTQRSVTARTLHDALEACDVRGLTREALSTKAGAVAHRTLATMRLPDASPHTPSIATDGERRQVVALSCIVNVRTTTNEGDPELVDELLHSVLSSCALLASEHGGTPVAMIGNEILCYFGFPRASEDAPLRAARAAIAVTDALREERARLSTQKAADLQGFLGIHSGIVTSFARGSVTQNSFPVGETPRITRGVAAQAQPGTVLVTSDAQRLLRTTFALTARGQRLVPGVPEALEVFELQREATADTTVDPPLVGRDHEIQLLLAQWARSQRGEGQCSLLTGEPGIGKSRIIREIERRTAGDNCLSGRCTPESQYNALSPIVEMIERAFGMDRIPSPQARAERFATRLADYHLPVERLMPLFAPLFALPAAANPPAPGLSPLRQRELTLEALISLILAMSEERPMILVVEDLHWADPATVELLGGAVQEAAAVPLWVLLTARPELTFPSSSADLLHLPLTRLGPTQVAEMIAGLTERKPIPPELMQQVVDRTDGVPLFVEELSRMILDSGWLKDCGSHYEFAGPAPNAEIPTTLRGLLMARLDRVGRAKDTAQLASAIGRQFSIEILAAVSPRTREDLEQDLDSLSAAGLVCRMRRSAEPTGVFKHALVRDAAYESLPRSSRIKAHAHIAATLEHSFPTLCANRPDLLARHHAAAEQYDSAFPYGLRAMQNAASHSHNREAVALGETLLEYVAMRPPELRASLELTVNELLTPALMATRGWGDERVRASVERSRRLLSDLGDSDRVFPMLCSHTLYHHVAGNRAEARKTALELLETAARLRDVNADVVARTFYGQCRWIDGDYIESEKYLQAAIDRYDPGAHKHDELTLGVDARVWAAVALGQVHWFRGGPNRARECIRQALAWAEELRMVPTLGLALMYDALICQYAGNKAQADLASTKAIALADEYGLPAIDGYCRFLQFWARDDAESGEPILSAMEGMGCRLALGYYGSLAAHTWMERGEYERALKRIEACIERCTQMDEHYYEPELHRRAATCLHHLGADESRVAAALHTAQRQAQLQGMRKCELDALVQELREIGCTTELLQRITQLRETCPEALDADQLAFLNCAGQ